MIDWTKPVRTKGSKTPVKILSLEGPGNMSVVGYLMDGDTDICQWYPGGGFAVDPHPSDLDLENVPDCAVYSLGPVNQEGCGKWSIYRKVGEGPIFLTAHCYSPKDADLIIDLLNRNAGNIK